MVFLMLCAALAACAQGENMSLVSIRQVDTRPQSTIGPPVDTRASGWTAVDVQFSSSLAEVLTRNAMTFHAEVTDCRGRRIHTDEFYSENVPLDQLRFGRSHPAVGTDNGNINATVYLDPTVLLNAADDVCIRGAGGSMVGGKIETNEVVIAEKG